MSAVIETQRQLEDVVEDLLSSVHGVPKKRTVNPVYDTEDITELRDRETEKQRNSRRGDRREK
jgi:hypothetical protein